MKSILPAVSVKSMSHKKRQENWIFVKERKTELKAKVRESISALFMLISSTPVYLKSLLRKHSTA